MIPFAILTIADESDREFMTRLYLDYRLLMFSEIRKLVDDQWAAEDLIQDAVVKLIDKLELLRTLDKPRLAGYVATTAKNLALNYLRAQSRSPVHYEDLGENLLQSELDVESLILSSQTLDDLKAIWPNLKPDTQELLERKYILQQNDSEIASAFSIAPASVRMKLTRARQEAYLLMQERAGAIIP